MHARLAQLATYFVDYISKIVYVHVWPTIIVSDHKIKGNRGIRIDLADSSSSYYTLLSRSSKMEKDLTLPPIAISLYIVHALIIRVMSMLIRIRAVNICHDSAL